MRENLTPPFGGRGEGPTGHLYLGEGDMEDNVYLDISTLITNQRTLGFHVRFQPKREVGAQNVGT